MVIDTIRTWLGRARWGVTNYIIHFRSRYIFCQAKFRKIRKKVFIYWKIDEFPANIFHKNSGFIP